MHTHNQPIWAEFCPTLKELLANLIPASELAMQIQLIFKFQQPHTHKHTQDLRNRTGKHSEFSKTVKSLL